MRALQPMVLHSPMLAIFRHQLGVFKCLVAEKTRFALFEECQREPENQLVTSHPFRLHKKG